jgi:hypothetical protein
MELFLLKEDKVIQDRCLNMIGSHEIGCIVGVIFQHYKGNRYQCVGFSIDEPTGMLNVLYVPKDAPINTIPISRRLSLFFGKVENTMEYRFAYVMRAPTVNPFKDR